LPDARTFIFPALMIAVCQLASRNALPRACGSAYHRDMTFWQTKATRHGYENPCSLSGAAMLREDSQPRTGMVAM
jgi:hypothetical protein